MPPRQSITLTEAELRLMKLLWSRGESSVAELTQSLADDTPLAYTSVLTTIRVLEKKSYVTHRQEGRAFFYTASIAEHEASRLEVRHVLGRFFGNSRERLLLALLGDHDITPAELTRIQAVIAQAPEDAKPADDSVARDYTQPEEV